MMMRKGIVLPDRFLDYIKGYTSLYSSAREAMGCFVEVRNVSEGVFVTHRESDFFSIVYPQDLDLQRVLNDYFLGQRHAPRNLYPTYGLGSFLGQAAQSLLIIGRAAYEYDWEEKEINEDKYSLPVDFHHLPDSTISPKRSRGKIVKYVQRYSWFTYLFDPSFVDRRDESKPSRKTTLETDKILYFEYFDKKSPVQKAQKYVKSVRQFHLDSLNRSKAGAQPEDKSLSLLLARRKSFEEMQKSYHLSQALLRRQFDYFLAGSQFDYFGTDGLKITQYYDIYLVVQYLKYKNKLRSHIVESFNRQVLFAFAKKNELEFAPKLTCSGFATDEELDDMFNKYQSGEFSHKDAVEYINGLSVGI